MASGPRELSGSEIVDIARQVSDCAVDGGVNHVPILRTFDIKPGIFPPNDPANDLWLRIVQAFYAGRSGKAGYRSDAVGRLVGAVGQELGGNDELNQLAYNLGQGGPSNPTGQCCIFLSYSSKDRQQVDRLYSSLVNKDPVINVFQDHRSIALGRDWLNEIRENAGRAAIMACWLTGDYLNSTFCHYEVGIADHLRTRIISIQDHNLALNTPTYLSRLQALKYSQPINYDNIAQELIRAL